MDTTPKYIKMCKEAKEIQAIWHKSISEGDYGCIIERDHNNSKNEVVVITEVSNTQGIKTFSAKGIFNHVGASWFFPEKNIWLLTQSQLQKMVKFDCTIECQWQQERSTFCLTELFYKFHRGKYYFGTLEQVWLAFVMHEKYDKHWDNKKEEWITRKQR